MHRYYFHIKNRESLTDVDGLELLNIEAVREEAVGFARDLVRMEPDARQWVGCTVHVTDETEATVFEIKISDVV